MTPAPIVCARLEEAGFHASEPEQLEPAPAVQPKQ